MKKLLFTLLTFALLASIQSTNGQTVYPKSCVHVTTPLGKMTKLENKAQKLYGATPNFHITTSKASISQVVIATSLEEATVADGKLQTGNILSVEAGYVIGAASATVYEDSTVLISGFVYYGLAAIYGQSTLSKKPSLILSPIIGYSYFCAGAGFDALAKSNIFRITFSANLAGLIPSLTSIKL